MPNPTQPDVLERMIARLEEANARSYNEPSRADETSVASDHHDGNQSSNQRAVSERRSSWASSSFAAVIVLLIAAPVFLANSTSEPSYLNALKLTFARWVHASVLQTRPEMAPQGGAVPAPSIPPEIEERLQRMADELADLHLRVEQTKTSQDQVRESGAETAAQLRIDRKQMMSDSENIFEQLKATQEQLKATQAQLAEVVSAKSASSSRKSVRRKRGSPLSLRPRAQSVVR